GVAFSDNDELSALPPRDVTNFVTSRSLRSRSRTTALPACKITPRRCHPAQTELRSWLAYFTYCALIRD
ncbi:hypothetical protein M5D96_001384, partial [Drosophila gunungcola]